MILVVMLGLLAGTGCVGVLYGARAAHPSLEAVARVGGQPVQVATSGPSRFDVGDRIGAAAVDWATDAGVLRHPKWQALAPSMAVARVTPERLMAQLFMAVGAAVLMPPVLWVLAQMSGVALPLAVPVLVAVVLAPVGACVPFLALISQAKHSRRHARVVIGTYVDLVVLSLAGGVGVEGALLAAAGVSSDWVAKRISRALLLARDTGQSSWSALSGLGDELGVPELVELSTTLQLAGTEGARIRQSLSARAVSLRRHEQAEAESSANAMTERLFLPGALLLVGFLLFIGYPAVSRIVGGF